MANAGSAIGINAALHSDGITTGRRGLFLPRSSDLWYPNLAEKVIGQRFDFLTKESCIRGHSLSMWTPFMILMTLAALGSVPKAELEAAEIDQIPWLKRIWYIILPNGSSSCSASSACDRRLQDDGLGAPDDQRRPRRHYGMSGSGLFRIGFEAFQVGMLSVGDHHAARRDCLRLDLFNVLNYRETRAQLK